MTPATSESLLFSVFRMWPLRKMVWLTILVSVVLLLTLFHSWPTRLYTTVDVWQRPGPLLERHLGERLRGIDPQLENISFHVRDHVARYGQLFHPFIYPIRRAELNIKGISAHSFVSSLLARNGCVCEGKSGGVNLPFAQLLFSRVSAQSLSTAFKASELDEIKRRRAKEYESFQKRYV